MKKLPFKIVALVLMLFGVSLASCLSRRERVEVLRNEGFQHLIKKEFEDADYYYVAALTLSQQEEERFINDRALYNYGQLFSRWERYALTVERLEDLLIDYRKKKSRRGEMTALNNLGEVYFAWWKYPLALEFFQESLRLAEGEGSHKRQCGAQNNIGKTLFKMKKYDGALEHFFRSREMAVDYEMAECLADAHLGIGRVLEKREGKKRAEKNYRKALFVSRLTEYTEGEELALEVLGKFFKKEKNNRLALSFLIPTLTMKLDVVDQKGSARLWHLVADTFFQDEKYLQAHKAYAEAFRIRFEIKDFYECCILLKKLGRVYRKMGKANKALHYYSLSRKFFRTLGDMIGESRTLLETAKFYAALGKYKEALGRAKWGLKITLDIEDRPGERDMREFLAKIYRGKGEINEAVDEMKEVLAIDEEIKSDRTQEDARFLKELTDTL